MRNPILKAILESEGTVRIYALNGLAVAYANEIEDTMFWCYFAATGQSWENAADSFYQMVKFSKKQDKTDLAITKRLAGTEYELVWVVLNRRIQSLLGEGNSIRNLIGHNAVSITLYALPHETIENRTIVTRRLEVVQKRAMVERKQRPKVRVGDGELASYCDELIQLHSDLEKFAEDALQFGNTHPLRYARGEAE